MTEVKAPYIMLVDDSDIDLFLNKKFLRVSGITDNTISFLSAKEALNHLGTHAASNEQIPDFLLLDIQMPHINGFQFLDEFVGLPETVQSKVKIVMLSSTLDPVDLDRAHANNAVADILKKPLDPEELKKVIAAQG